MTRRIGDKGVVLVTILVVMALCVTVIVAMTNASERATRTTLGELEAAQARALVAAGEASAISALLRDLENPPEADGMTEDWASLDQSDIAIQGGRFQLEITDGAGRFNLNTLIAESSWARRTLDAIVSAAGLKSEVSARIAAALAGGRQLHQIEDLASRAGLSKAEIAALAPFATCSPDFDGGVNANTAPSILLLALIKNPKSAERIIAERDNRLITPATLEKMGIELPEGITLGSNVFDLKIAVSSGGAQMTAESTIHRWRDESGQAHAAVSGRRLSSQ